MICATALQAKFTSSPPGDPTHVLDAIHSLHVMLKMAGRHRGPARPSRRAGTDLPRGFHVLCEWPT